MRKPLRIIQIDDNPGDRALVLREMRKEFGEIESVEVRDEQEFQRALERGGFDLAITDYHIGWTDGLKVLRAIKGKYPDCPIVMLTGTGTEEVAVEAMKLGLDDYVLKQPQRMVRLGATARAALEKVGLRLERRRDHEALRESEERFRQMAEHIQQVFYIVSLDPRKVLYVSPAFERIWGRSCESLYDDPMSWLDGIDLEDRPRAADMGRSGLGAGYHTLEYRVRRPDGSVRWVEDRAFEVAGEDGRPYRLVGAVMDITDRKLAEEFREKLASLTASGINPVLEFDISGKITYHNAAGQVIVDALEATEPREALQAEILSIVCACLRTGEKNIGLETVLEGRTFTWAFIPVMERQVVHAYVSDISHHLELESKLRQSEKMEVVGRLSGGIAHDFNNLLTVILGYTGFVLEELPAGSPLSADVIEVRKAADRAVDLGRQLLAFSRRQVVQPHVLDLNRVVSDTLTMLKRLMPENIVEALEPCDVLGRIRIDPGQIEQVIMNLALNARDAMPGGGRIVVRTSNVTLAKGYKPRHIGLPPGSYVALSVSDTGAGIDRETMAHLFEPFYTTKDLGRGTGLGLATVHWIVKQAGGDIWVDTELGKGTTFTIYLPRVWEEARPAAPERPQTRSSSGSETILLAEDDEKIRTMAVRALKSKGYMVLDAANGEDAIGLAKRHTGSIHLLVSDVVMPGMGGSDLAGSLSALHPEMKILYVSGYAGVARQGGGPMGPDCAYLQKPFTPASLITKVRETLDGAGSL